MNIHYKKYTTFNSKVITIVQLIGVFGSLIGLFFVPWTIGWILVSVFFFYLYSAVGVSMMLHRYFSHRTFQFKNNTLKWIFTIISVVSSRGSPIAWVHIHREHHANADTDKDPHRPSNFSLFSFRTTTIKNIKAFLIKDLLTKEQKFIHEHYVLFILIWALILFLINPLLLYFAWIFPIFLNQVSQDLWNYFSHVNVGYRNFKTKDNSRNVKFLFPVILGEAWHNNHHDMPSLPNLSVKWWEFDPIYYLIRSVGVISYRR